MSPIFNGVYLLVLVIAIVHGQIEFNDHIFEDDEDFIGMAGFFAGETGTPALSVTPTTVTDMPSTTVDTSLVMPSTQQITATSTHAEFPMAIAKDNCLVSGDDSTLTETLNIEAPIGDRKSDRFVISTDGWVCLDENNGNSQSKLPREPPAGDSNIFNNKYCVAPYYTDMTATDDDQVCVTVYDIVSAGGFDGSAFNNLKQTMSLANIPATYEIVLVLVATWDGVTRPDTTGAKTVTFQYIYVTDGQTQHSFVFYKDNQMQFTDGSIFVGTINDGTVGRVLKTNAELQRPDQYAYIHDVRGCLYLKTPSTSAVAKAVTINYGAQCLTWVQTELVNENTNRARMWSMPPCFCDRLTAMFVGIFIPFGSWNNLFLPRLGFTKTCVYDNFGNLIRNGGQAGTFKSVSPFSPSYYGREEQYRIACCERSNNCQHYHRVRPRDIVCARIVIIVFVFGNGDPHFKTLDGQNVTFNGHGEYTLMQIQTQTVNFTLQCRTSRWRKDDDSLTDATVFSAFAMRGSNAFAQVQLDNTGTSLEVFAGDGTYVDDYTFDFENDGNFSVVLENGMSLTGDQTKLTITHPDGVIFNVTNNNKLLTMAIGVSKDYIGSTSGLVGNFNGDAADDMIPKGSQTPIPVDSNERQIFEYGKTWITSAETSIFLYKDGESWTTHNFPDFVPKFLDEEDPAAVAQAQQVCGEDTACIFDYVLTGSQSVAIQTLDDNEEAREVSILAANEAPSIDITDGILEIDGDNFLYVVQNQPVTFSVNASDDGTFTYGIDSSLNDVIVITDDGQTAEVAVTLPNSDPEHIQILVTDNLGLKGAADIVTVFCSGCSNHGNCSFLDTRNDNRTTDFFKYARCECDTFWQGVDCETAVDLCDPNPCSFSRVCTGIPAASADTDPTFVCAPCPAGYLHTSVTRAICNDIDECSDGVDDCSQLCVNTEGSFSCACDPGYRLNDDAKTCSDINECDEGTSGCQQVCTNTPGGATCSCFDGFTYNTGTETCTESGTPACNIDCSSAHGCLEVDGTFECVCRAGYNLENNQCVDIDECEQPLCSQNCSNSAGSFSCSCFAGFQLQPDQITCTECESPFYGDNCESSCQFRDGVAGCDPAVGLICSSGYELPACDDIDECTVNPDICGDANKLCNNLIGSYECNCRDGFSTDENGNCIDADECLDATLSQCSQQCNNSIGGFSCSCYEGYITDQDNNTNCIDIDECTQGSSLCEHQCENTPGRYRCLCYAGYILNTDRRSCIKVEDLCLNQAIVNCSHICRFVDGTLQCFCPTGYTLGTDAQTCADIDECTTGTHQCTGSCVNTDGGYTCSCPSGSKLDNDGRTCTACDDYHYGTDCASLCACQPGATRCDPVSGCVCSAGWSGDKCGVDRNECSVSASDDPCPGTNFICVNTFGSYLCKCEDGYTQNDAGACVDIDECSSIALNNCVHTCTNTVGSYTCSCRDGFVGDGFTCQDINECDSQNTCSQLCVNTDGGYRCSCNDGYRLNLVDRTSCIANEVCSTNICTNGDCVRVNGVDTCYCNKGYEFAPSSSTDCVDIKECDRTPSPCSQECVEGTGGYTCNCNEAGTKLDLDQATCIPCSEGQYGVNCAETCACNADTTETCNPIDGGCTCKSGWTGADCSQDINECTTNNPCPALSQCLNSDGSYTCVCNGGYFMSNNMTCYDENECATGTNQCEQICTNTPGSYSCSCRTGYTQNGISCTPCFSNTYGDGCSQNCDCNTTNSVIQNQSCNIETGTCNCKDEWSGLRCETDVNECTTDAHGCSPTANEGCHNTIGSFECSCFVGYKRDPSNNCEEDTATVVTTPSTPAGQVVIDLFIRFDLVIPDHVDLNVTLTNTEYKAYVEVAMLEYIRNKIGDLVKGITALTVSKGSLNTDMSVTLADSTEAKQQFSNAIQELVINNETVSINNENTRVERLTVENNTVDVNNMSTGEIQCHVYEAIQDHCHLANYECIINNGKPLCRRREGETDIDLLIGLGVGIPLLMILVVVIAVVVIYMVRSKRRRLRHKFSSVDSDRTSDSAFSRGIPTRINTHRTDVPYLGFPKLYEDDDVHSFTSEAESRRQLRMHQGHQYDNTEYLPESSWGYLYRNINPANEFRIKRPKVDY